VVEEEFEVREASSYQLDEKEEFELRMRRFDDKLEKGRPRF